MLQGVWEIPLPILYNMRSEYFAMTLAGFQVIGGEILLAASFADLVIGGREESLGRGWWDVLLFSYCQ